ncbi:C-_U-editing enzyme APOBEC-1 isoform X2 [Crotalus tigris]|uniref:C->U-editing enzyme APOBEC-1 isoform X1 n=1 Tax=Crotalus tigris TaxID=88082 RepID=UPI00192F511B|nr:C->U-editing enzyme APOBEC-1 isoform X1 [Crotalus tigris]XP_039201171.1 C->U-editing enzyme APOBEC-1 isoform X2 [Crotalus tigris]
MEPQMPARKGWQIESKDFWENYAPKGRPETTYILYEIQWGSHKIWRHWCTNSFSQHAEINALDKHEEILQQNTTRCHIIWYLSWSPCGICSQFIIEFLKKHPNVTLKIKVAQLFSPNDKRNKNGLRKLVTSGVQLFIMSQSDYYYCGRTFVAQRRMDNCYLKSWDFLFSIWHNLLYLNAILNE